MDLNILGVNEANKPRPALIAQAVAGGVPAHHDVLHLAGRDHERPALAVDLAAPRDAGARGVLGQYDVPPARLGRVVRLPGPAQKPRAGGHIQHHPRAEVDGRCQVVARRWEKDAAPARRRAGVYSGLNRRRVVMGPIARRTIVGHRKDAAGPCARHHY